MFSKLYGSFFGRLILKIITAPFISKTIGAFLDTRISVIFIPHFIKSHNIDMTETETKDWESFNDFFTRKLESGARPIDPDECAMLSPCDGYLKAVKISQGTVMAIKDVPYTTQELLRSKEIADSFEGGYCLIYRLTTAEYHRYNYPVSGRKSKDIHIAGILHTVRPEATTHTPVYVQNSRSCSLIKSDTFGPVVFMQVGALLVGRIRNLHTGAFDVKRGSEAGYFEYGGSTVIVLVKAGKLVLDESIEKASAAGQEYYVRLGERIGEKA